MYLIYNVLLVLGIWQSYSDILIYMCTYKVKVHFFCCKGL